MAQEMMGLGSAMLLEQVNPLLAEQKVPGRPESFGSSA
jgi:hypothetical protein